MKTKSFVTLLAVAVILGSIIGGALAGGIAIGKSQGRQEASQGLQNQTGGYYSLPSGLGNATTGQGNFQLPGNNTGISSGSRATMGTVESVEGSVVTLKTQDGPTVLVNISDSTSIQKTIEGSLEDIAVGDSIAVSGDKNEDNSIDATSISLVSGITFGGGLGPGQ